MKRVILLAVIGLVLTTTAASAQMAGIGPRLGVSIDPDQFAFGGQVKVGPYSSDIFLVPNIEVGLGDDLTIIQFNFDVDYYIPVSNTSLAPYVGAGLGVAVIDFDNDRFGRTDSNTEAGLNILGGLQFANSSRNSSFFTEMRIGIGDIPELKFMVGWNFSD